MSHFRPLFATVTAVSALVMLPACGASDKTSPPPPQTGSLTSTMDMIGKDGKRYGTVEMDPVGGGKVYDSHGRLIGTIVPPER